jgi:hypothetical protein
MHAYIFWEINWNFFLQLAWDIVQDEDVNVSKLVHWKPLFFLSFASRGDFIFENLAIPLVFWRKKLLKGFGVQWRRKFLCFLCLLVGNHFSIFANPTKLKPKPHDLFWCFMRHIFSLMPTSHHPETLFVYFVCIFIYIIQAQQSTQQHSKFRKGDSFLFGFYFFFLLILFNRTSIFIHSLYFFLSICVWMQVPFAISNR